MKVLHGIEQLGMMKQKRCTLSHGTKGVTNQQVLRTGCMIPGKKTASMLEREILTL